MSLLTPKWKSFTKARREDVGVSERVVAAVGWPEGGAGGEQGAADNLQVLPVQPPKQTNMLADVFIDTIQRLRDRHVGREGSIEIVEGSVLRAGHIGRDGISLKLLRNQGVGTAQFARWNLVAGVIGCRWLDL